MIKLIEILIRLELQRLREHFRKGKTIAKLHGIESYGCCPGGEHSRPCVAGGDYAAIFCLA